MLIAWERLVEPAGPVEKVQHKPADWPAAPAKKWEMAIGGGHSSPVVSGDRVIVHARQDDKEIIRAIALSTGKELWRNEYAAPYTVNPAARAHGPGPKSTPAVAVSSTVTAVRRWWTRC